MAFTHVARVVRDAREMTTVGEFGKSSFPNYAANSLRLEAHDDYLPDCGRTQH